MLGLGCGDHLGVALPRQVESRGRLISGHSTRLEATDTLQSEFRVYATDTLQIEFRVYNRYPASRTLRLKIAMQQC